MRTCACVCLVRTCSAARTPSGWCPAEGERLDALASDRITYSTLMVWSGSERVCVCLCLLVTEDVCAGVCADVFSLCADVFTHHSRVLVGVHACKRMGAWSNACVPSLRDSLPPCLSDLVADQSGAVQLCRRVPRDDDNVAPRAAMERVRAD